MSSLTNIVKIIFKIGFFSILGYFVVVLGVDTYVDAKKQDIINKLDIVKIQVNVFHTVFESKNFCDYIFTDQHNRRIFTSMNNCNIKLREGSIIYGILKPNEDEIADFEFELVDVSIIPPFEEIHKKVQK